MTETTPPTTGRATVERGLRLVAGAFVLATVLLAALHSLHWLWFTGFVGANLLQSAFTNWCPMVWLLERFGLPRCPLNASGVESGEPGPSQPQAQG